MYDTLPPTTFLPPFFEVNDTLTSCPSPGGLGNLDREGAYAPACANDQDLPTRLDIRPPQKMQRMEPPNGDGGRLLIRHVGRHSRDEPLLRQTIVLRIGAEPEPREREDPVALLEPRHTLPHQIDLARQLLPQYLSPRPPEAEPNPHGNLQRHGELEAPQFAVTSRRRRGMDSDQYLIILRDGPLHLSELKDIGRSVPGANDRFHERLRGFSKNGHW